MPKRKYKLYLEPHNRSDVPCVPVRQQKKSQPEDGFTGQLSSPHVTGNTSASPDGFTGQLSSPHVTGNTSASPDGFTRQLSSPHVTGNTSESPDGFTGQLSSPHVTGNTSASPVSGVEEWEHLYSEEDDGTGQDIRSDCNTLLDSDMDSPLTATGSTTKAEALLMLISYVAKHKVTGVQLDDLLSLINQLFGKQVVPRSKYLFNNVFKKHSNDVEFQFYCKTCNTVIGTTAEITEKNLSKCKMCDAPFKLDRLNSGSFFINLPLAPQIQAVLEATDVSSHLNYRFDRRKSRNDMIADIYDGEKYKTLCGPGEILSHSYNLSYTFNSDGSPVFNSAKFSIWPIHIMINELPPKVRCKYLILAGLWCGAQEPLMDIFLKPFVEQGKQLANSGVNWTLNGSTVNSKVIGICCCVDSKARPLMQNTTQFNGYFGCSFCFHPGKLVEKVVKYPVSADEYDDRTSHTMLRDMELAVESDATVRGVKGPTPLINLPYFDVVWGFSPDYMHATLLGVSRQITKLLVDTSSSTQPYYVGQPATLQTIDERIMSIKPPHLITRLPRGLSERMHWKASEWRSWLLFYGLPCLDGILPRPYFKHLSLLVSALFLLLQEEISPDDLVKSEVLLLDFTFRFQMLYGESQMTFNIHLLGHLPKSVRMLGPLWAHSAFPFENANGALLRLVKGTKGVAQQIVNKFLVYRSIPYFTMKHAVKDRVLQFCADMNNHSVVKCAVRCDDVVLLDSGTTYFVTPEEREVFNTSGVYIPNEIVVHKRMAIAGLIFTSQEYTLSHRREECYVELVDGRCGAIEKILSCLSNDIMLMIKPCSVAPAYRLSHHSGFVPHIKMAKHFEDSILVPVAYIRGKCMFFSVDCKQYVCNFPNTHERD